MEHLPPVGWADVATTRDLDHLSMVTRRDLELESTKLRGEMQVGFAAVRGEMETGFAAVRGEIAAAESRFERALRDQTRTVFLGLLASNATITGVAFAAARLV
jgi:hypothetical protein